jgi:serine/threonine-protein kinase
MVKVLDFGLAKTADTHATANASISPTLTIRATEAGLILGTAAYMSPEQAAGKPVDKRTDIWSYGVVLWEMLTGKRLFDGETISHTLADVLRTPINLDGLPKKTPHSIRNLLWRCLQRDIKTRLRDIGEARIALVGDYLANSPDEVPNSRSASARPLWISWTVAAVLAVALLTAGLGWYRTTRSATLRPLIRLDLILPDDTSIANNVGGGVMALSPDGSRLALLLRSPNGTVRLYTRLLNQNQFAPLAGTENAKFPFFSPDGQWIGFFDDTKLKKIAVEGGAAIALWDAPQGRGASWGEDGNIIAALTSTPFGVLARVPSAGGNAGPVDKTGGIRANPSLAANSTRRPVRVVYRHGHPWQFRRCRH